MPRVPASYRIEVAKGTLRTGYRAEYEKYVTLLVRNLRLMLEGSRASITMIDEPPMLPRQEWFFTEPVHGHSH